MSNNNSLIEKILTALPQLQCKKCEYEDCLSYAKAVVENNEELNKCEPGQFHTEKQLNNILSGINTIQPNEIKNYHIFFMVFIIWVHQNLHHIFDCFSFCV